MTWAPFSKKALTSMATCDAFINMYEGAVRSSKTVASTIAWLNFMKKSPHREFLMTGKTIDTLFRNVLSGPVGLLSIMGKKAKFYKNAQGGSKLVIRFKEGIKVCYCLGANDERAEGNLRGMTIAGWYADEVTLYPESFVKQAINRMSLDGAQAFWTMNPDSPYHYIKKEFIDKAKDKGYRLYHFELDDNLALSQRYKDEIKKAYSGLWYKRMILGLWVLAEGAIYDMFDEDVHIVEAPKNLRRFGIAIDYGTTNPCTFGLYGFNIGPPVWLVDEYYYDSKSGKNPKQKTDSEYAEDFVNWWKKQNLRPHQLEAIYVDPSAASFIAELKKKLKPLSLDTKIKHANNSVLDGIRFVASMLTMEEFLIDPSCEYTKAEFTSYIWDEKSQTKGEDKPLKQNDHTMDRNRYFLYSHFGRRRAAVATARRGMG